MPQQQSLHMLTRMRKILIAISVLILLLAAAVGGTYTYVQYQLSQLPVENLNYRIAGVGYKHIRLSEVSFRYIEPTRDVDAVSSGFRSGSAALEAPVQLNDIFITWQWHGFTPNLQIVEVGQLDFTLSHWPATLQQADDALDATWRLPGDWRVPEDLPHQFSIKKFIVDLPCADRCYYSGNVRFTSENKERLLTADEPQRTQLNVTLSPHQQFHEMEQLNIYLDYRIDNDLPELGIVVQSPMALNLQARHQIDRTNALQGELDFQLEPSAHWVFTELWRWLPQLEAKSKPVLSFLSDSLSVHASYQSTLPDTSIERWINEISAELNATVMLQDQLEIQFDSQLERDDQIAFDGHLNAVLLPGLRANLSPLLSSPDTRDHHSASASTNASSEFQASALLAQLDSPVSLDIDWALTFPPGTQFSSWADQVDGTLAAQISSDNEFVFAQFGVMELASQIELQLAAGLVQQLDLIVNGGFDLLAFNDQLSTFTLEPGRVHWSVTIDADEFIDWSELPVHVQAQSTGSSDITMDAQLFADVQSLINATNENQPEYISIRSQRGQLMMRQPELYIQNIHASDIELEMPFNIRFSEPDGLQMDSASAGHIHMALNVPFNDQLIATPQLEVALPEWQWQMPTDTLTSRFSTQLDIHATHLEVPALLPINWRWFGSFAIEPLREQLTVHANGRLTNSAGLLLRQQVASSAERLTVDWQLADIFWLAGNPIAGTLDGLWPELLTLERGRTRAAGQIHVPLADGPLTLTAELELLDVAGIYDTASFSGVRAQLSGRSDGELFDIALEDGYLQRLQYGMTHGPGEFQFSYRGNVSAPLDGTLEIRNNRLSVLNGVVSLLPASYDLNEPEHTFYVNISQLDIARLLAEYPAADIQGNGLLSGSIPIRYSPQGIFVDSGQIAALPPGGQIQYRSGRARQMAESNVAMGIVMEALDDFHYSALQGQVTYLEDGTLQLGLLIEGRNPKLERGRPVRLEVTLQEDLPALLTSLQLTNQLNEIIQERIQQRLIQGLRN